MVDVRADLESIPRLLASITGMWATQELDAFVNHLVMDSRDGSRSGLPVPVAAEVVFLAGLNKMVRAMTMSERTGEALAACLTHIDAIDDEHARADKWDDPLVSRDTVVRQRDGKNRRGAAKVTPESGGQLRAALALVVLFMSNKWVIGTVVLMLTLKLLLSWK